MFATPFPIESEKNVHPTPTIIRATGHQSMSIISMFQHTDLLRESDRVLACSFHSYEYQYTARLYMKDENSRITGHKVPTLLVMLGSYEPPCIVTIKMVTL